MFEEYTKTPNSISYGKLYITSIEVPYHKEKRTIRVWTPEGYNPDDKITRYKVIYMCDGQNLVDKYTSAFGEWNMDVICHNLMKEGYEPFIVVGIDSPKSDAERMNELCTPIPTRKFKGSPDNPIGNLFADHLFSVVKPLVDKYFNTLPERENTGIGGSSMGGLMAFYCYAYKREYVGFSLCFSPAFFLYHKDKFIKGMKTWSPEHEDYGKIFFFVGGRDFEKLFVNRTLDMYFFLKRRGFEDEQVALIYDSNQYHHESSWGIYAPNALRFWLKKLR